MTRATLSEVLQSAMRGGYAVAGFVCLGWEDARAYAMAAEAEGAPVILQAGPSCRAHTPLPILGRMFTHLAESVTVPLVAHLDHGRNEEECRQAIGEGFTSVMFDGSDRPFAENAAATARVAEMAHRAGVSCEGEIGVVGYASGAASLGTDPREAAVFAKESGVDALAVSVGNVHLKRESGAGLDEGLLREIEAVTDLPLVIHGGSGVPEAQRTRLAQTSNICKFNIGTELRMVFGKALRETLAADPEAFDRIAILKRTEPPMMEAARRIIRSLSAPGG